MIERAKVDSKLNLSMRRLKPWEVQLTQKGDSIRPHVNRATNGTSLLILGVTHKAFRGWNTANPEEAVRKNDRIVQVNGVEGEAKKMMDQVESDPILKMMVVRPLPEN